MEITRMTLEDVEAVYTLGASEPGFKVSNSSGFWTSKQLCSWVEADQDVLLVAKDGPLVVGFLLTTMHQPTGKVVFENHFVLPSHQNLGVAKLLMDEALRILRKRGAMYICFAVKESNGHALRYYSRYFVAGETFVWFERYVRKP